MNRRRVLLIVAAMIAALGTLLIFLYVQGADRRASEAYDPVQVLKVVEQINVGENIDAAQAAGKIQQAAVPRAQVVAGALDSITPIAGKIALVPIYAGEQVVSAKFGDTGASNAGLNIPDGKIAISINMSDTGRVAGFINPGAKVALFITAADIGGVSGRFTRLLLPEVEVIAVGTTTLVSQTTTQPGGAQTTEQLPRTLFTLALTQQQAEKVMFATGGGELTFAMLTDKSEVALNPGVNDRNLFG